MVLRENAMALVESASVMRVAVEADAPSVTWNVAKPKSSGLESVGPGATPSSAACDSVARSVEMLLVKPAMVAPVGSRLLIVVRISPA